MNNVKMYNKYNILMVGDKRVGKSALICTLLDNPFTENYIPTINTQKVSLSKTPEKLYQSHFQETIYEVVNLEQVKLSIVDAGM